MLTVFGGVCGSQCYAQQSSEGCPIPAGHAKSYFERATRAPEMSATGNYKVEPRSGDPQLDFAFAQALGTIARTFDVLPGFAYYDDYDQPNAKATSEAMLDRSDGTVLFGLRLLRELLKRPEREASVIAFAAHEFGHIACYKRGQIEPLVRARGTFGGEQYADYMCGFFAGRRRLENPNYPSVAFAVTFGDYAGGSTHGDRRQRTSAIQQGFIDAHQRGLSFEQAASAGFTYAMSSH